MGSLHICGCLHVVGVRDQVREAWRERERKNTVPRGSDHSLPAPRTSSTKPLAVPRGQWVLGSRRSAAVSCLCSLVAWG